MPEPTNTAASLSLNFVVVGGGLAGFSVAYVLCKSGHKVRVLEKLPAIGSPAGGLRVPPNMSKLLKKWVGAEELAKTAVQNVRTPWYDLETGKVLGESHWRPVVMTETGGDFLLMKHEDVHRLVHRLAVSAGAQINFGVSVTTVSPGILHPSVTLSTGEVVVADVIIGADGPRSMVREAVLGYEDDPHPSGFSVFGSTIPGTEMMKDPELAKLLQANEWPVFMGNNRSLCAHPVRAKTEFAVQLYWPDEDAGTPADATESWYDVVPTNSVNLEGQSDLIKRMLKMTPNLYRTRWMNRDSEIDEWIDESGKIVLMGEAAHPWFPGGTYGAAMALEDAVVFGTLFGHLSSWDQVPTFLNAYQEIRQERTTVVNKMDISNAAFVRLPPGPQRDARDANLSLAVDDWNDEAIRREFEGLVGLFGYEAEDAAHEWWVTWGRYGSEPNTSPSLQFQTQTVLH